MENLKKALAALLLLGSLAPMAAGGCSNTDDTTPGGRTDGLPECSSARDCETCRSYAYSNSKCGWCMGKCMDRPADVSSATEGGWCDWGYAESQSACTADGGIIVTQSVLPVDCRAGKNKDDLRCQEASIANWGKVGAGPQMPIARLHGGYLDAAKNRLILGGYFNGPNKDNRHGGIFAVDLTTGERTLLSGTYVDKVTGDVALGSGPDIAGVWDVKLAPDGTVRALVDALGGAQLMKVDLTTGARTLVYDGTSPKCVFAKANWAFTSTGLREASIAVDTDGTVYVPSGGPILPAQSDGYEVGVQAISPDGSCKVIAMSATQVEYKIGNGPMVTDSYRGMQLVGSTLYTTTLPGELVAVDVKTGNRTMISSAQDARKLGTGPGLMNGFLTILDASTFLVSGPDLAHFDEFFAYDVVDLKTGNRTPQPWEGYPHPHVVNDIGWVVAHPTMKGIMIIVTGESVLLFDPKSGSSMTLSH